MNNIEDKLKNIKEIKLSDKEKNILRTNFLNQIHSQSEAPKYHWLPTVSPFSMKLYSGAFAMLLVVIYTGSAEAALPGDNMYYFKTHINEPILQTMALTPQMKADVSVKLLNRRYEEVSKLSIDNETNTESWEELRTALVHATADANKSVRDLVDQNEYAEAASLINDQDAILEANIAILSKLDDTDTSDQLNSIVETMTDHQQDNIAVSAEINELLEDGDLGENLPESLDDSVNKLEVAEDSLTSEQETGDVSSAEILNLTIGKAKGLVEEGKKLFTGGDEVGAFLKFEEAKKILDTSLYINEAENELRIEIDNIFSTSSDPQIEESIN